MADRKLTASQAAEMVPVRLNTWWSYVSRDQAPAADGHETLSGKPWWWESTVRAWLASRVGRGRKAVHSSR